MSWKEIKTVCHKEKIQSIGDITAKLCKVKDIHENDTLHVVYTQENETLPLV